MVQADDSGIVEWRRLRVETGRQASLPIDPEKGVPAPRPTTAASGPTVRTVIFVDKHAEAPLPTTERDIAARGRYLALQQADIEAADLVAEERICGLRLEQPAPIVPATAKQHRLQFEKIQRRRERQPPAG